MGFFSFDNIDAPKARRIIAWLWTALVLLFLAAFIAGCVAASDLSAEAATGGLKFAASWTILCTLAVGVVGTRILQRYTTPLSVGVLVGGTTVLSGWYLVISAIFGFEADVARTNEQASSSTAFTVFAFFLFMLFGFFSFTFQKLSHLVEMKEADPQPEEYLGNSGNERGADQVDIE